MKFRMIGMAGIAAAALIATTFGAAAQAQTDRNGNAMGSQHVGNGAPSTMSPGKSGATGMNRGSGVTTGMNGANHPTPSSTQGDTGPGGNNNGTLSGTGATRR
ncbi:hypothetical protein [Rhodopseudomonas sp. B29]|uniref:hypothetical protein n=1 Tax=Rhodopseudomonas sp. B29 TaxID=95607 RepID=UPI000346084F|nr:hypothetical protein [Rhodopseudomonas sp. B29]